MPKSIGGNDETVIELSELRRTSIGRPTILWHVWSKIIEYKCGSCSFSSSCSIGSSVPLAPRSGPYWTVTGERRRRKLSQGVTSL